MRTRMKINRENIIAFIKANKEKSVEDMAREYGVSNHTIIAYASRDKISVWSEKRSVARPGEMLRRSRWLKDNNTAEMTVKEIGSGLGISTSAAYSYCVREKIPYKSSDSDKRALRQLDENKSELFFNPHERENWLV